MTEIVEEVKEPTREEILSKWSLAELKAAMAIPEKRSMLERIINTPTETPSEVDTEAIKLANEEAQQAEAAAMQASQEAETAARAAQELEASRQAEEQADAARKAAEPKKIVVEYQATDEDGNPIGRPTHLEAATWEEMSMKQRTAHIEATRAFNRLKKQKTTFKQPEPEQKKGMSDEEMLALAKNLNPEEPEKALESVRKLTGQDELEKERKAAKEAEENARQELVSYKFIKKHIYDYNNCQANNDLIYNYIVDNQLIWTEDNLEIALLALEGQLAPVEIPVAPIPAPVPVVQEIVSPTVVNPPVVAPTVPTPAPVAAAAPVVPAVPPVAAVNPPAARRIPDSGIQPGTLQGARPVTKPAGLTKADIKKWTGAEMRKQMQDPARRAEIERVLSGK